MKTATISNDNDNDPVASILESVKKEQEQYLKDMLPKIKHYYDTMGLCVLPQYPGQKRPAVYLWKEEAIPKRPSWKKTQELFKNAFQLCINEIDKVKKLAEEDPAKYADVYKVAKERGWKWGLGALTGHRSGVVVVDWDSPEARVEWLKRNPDTPWKTKTNKGGHGYYINDDQYEIKTDGKHFFEGTDPSDCFDIRGHGGFIVLPEGIHKSGYVYQEWGVWTQEKAIKTPVFDPAWIPPRPEKEPKDKPKAKQTPVFEKKPTQSQHGKEKSDLDKFMFHEYMKRACPEFTPKTIEGCMGYTSFCPCESEHKNVNADTDFGIWQNAEGEICTKCMHTSCGTWSFSRFHSIYPIKSEDFSDHGVTYYTCDDADVLTNTEYEWDEPAWWEVEDKPNPFPVEVLPEDVAAFVKEVAHKQNVDSAIVACTMFAVVSAYMCNVVYIKRKGWHGQIPPTFWCLILMGSGGGKSRGMSAVADPLRQIEAEKAAQVRTKRKSAEMVINTLKEKSKEFLKKQHMDDVSAAINCPEFVSMQKQIDELQYPRPNTMIFSDATIEALLADMQYTYQRKCCISGESPFIDLLTGKRYGSGDATLIACDLWDGATVSVDRKNSGSLCVERPCVTTCSCFTPEAFIQRLKQKEFTQGGFAQRFLYIRPPVILDTPKGDIDNTLLDWWSALVQQLDIAPTEDEHRVPQPSELLFSSDAQKALDVLAQVMVAKQKELLAADESELWKGWVTRVEAYAIRLSAILHAMRYGKEYRQHLIEKQEVERAVAIMKYFMVDADRILHIQGNPREQNAEVVWKYLLKKDKGERLPLRKIQRGVGRNINTEGKYTIAESLRLAIEELVAEGRPIKVHQHGGWSVERTK